jgi:hypothetical protein
MPETGIGLIPDVGGTWLLAHAPGAVGVYLGLTGEAMRAADAIYARFADAFIPSAKIGRLAERLIDAKGGSVETAMRALAEDAGPSQLAARRADIDHAFGGDSVEAMLAALSRLPAEWAQKTAATLVQKSPIMSTTDKIAGLKEILALCSERQTSLLSGCLVYLFGKLLAYLYHFAPPEIRSFNSENQFSTRSTRVMARSGSTSWMRRKRVPSRLILQLVLPLGPLANRPSCTTCG